MPAIPFELGAQSPEAAATTCTSARSPGVAVNSKGHVFVYSRGGSSAGPAYGNAASQLLEFDPDGKFVREIGKNLYAWSFAHTVRVDKDDNIWATDKGSDMIIKFNPQGRVVMVFGRKSEASDAEAKPHERNPEPPLPHQDGRFRQPTDVAWGPDGTIYISDGYVNSRVAKINKNGDWVKSWGQRGKGPGQFNLVTASPPTPRATSTSATAATGASRCSTATATSSARSRSTCRSTQNARPAIGNKPDLTNYLQTGGSFAPGAPWALCITPPPNQVLYGSDCLSGPHLQAVARRQGARRARQVGQAAQAVRLDPRDGVPVRERRCSSPRS